MRKRVVFIYNVKQINEMCKMKKIYCFKKKKSYFKFVKGTKRIRRNNLCLVFLRIKKSILSSIFIYFDQKHVSYYYVARAFKSSNFAKFIYNTNLRY